MQSYFGLYFCSNCHFKDENGLCYFSIWHHCTYLYLWSITGKASSGFLKYDVSKLQQKTKHKQKINQHWKVWYWWYKNIVLGSMYKIFFSVDLTKYSAAKIFPLHFIWLSHTLMRAFKWGISQIYMSPKRSPDLP